MDCEEARLAQADALAEKAGWSRDWAAAVVPFGLGPDAYPSEAEDAAQRLGAFFGKRDEAARLDAVRVTAEQEAATFERDALAVVTRTAFDLAAVPAPVAAAALYERLCRETDATTRRHALHKDLRRYEKALAESTTALADAEQRLSDLGRTAGCSDVAEPRKRTHVPPSSAHCAATAWRRSSWPRPVTPTWRLSPPVC
ncbi:MAG: hypothetical protein HYV63_25585 [Candidatus Schekmanbacteria bacterium]|nr:hypothetical protein [Candidatus Schekmanbacteria bacterium]